MVKLVAPDSTLSDSMPRFVPSALAETSQLAPLFGPQSQ
jgi:hypothetical protein